MSDATQKLEVGIFDWIDLNRHLSLGDTYEQRLRMLEVADEAGIWCYHLAEHHGTPLAVAPSPNLFLAAAAQRTRRIRLSPMVQLLPLYHPLRNIEEVAFLDNLSGGRLELGVGRGISAPELKTYGLTPDEARGMFDEYFEVLRMGLAQAQVTYEGKYYCIENAPLPIRAQQQPYPPLWYPTDNPERIPDLAVNHVNTLLGFSLTPVEKIAAGATLYRAALEKPAPASERLNPHVESPKYGATRHVFVAPSEAQGLDIAGAAYVDFEMNFFTRPGVEPLLDGRLAGPEAAVASGALIAGDPRSVLERLQAFIDATGVNYVALTFAFGSLNTEQVLDSLSLFAREVMPALTLPAPAQ